MNPPSPSRVLIEARDITKSFGQTPALRGASVAVAQGEILAVMGPSGSGKSTMLHCLAVPLASAVASLLALRRVQISPLGVTRRATPPPPSPWRLAPLAAGILLYIAGSLATSSEKIGVATYPGCW